jgi:hypothetical protein
MRKLLIALAWLASTAAGLGQAPPTQCTASNLNASYVDTINNVQYLCTSAGWKQNVGSGAPTVACAPKNYGQIYGDVANSVTYQCAAGGWFVSSGGGGGTGFPITLGSTSITSGSTTTSISGLTLVAPALGTPTALTLTNAVALPWTGITGTPSTTQVPVQSLTTTGSSGASTLSGGVLNIPQYSIGTTTNLLTLNNSGTGNVSGTTFNGSSAVTLSYNTIGAAPLTSPALAGTPTAPTQSCASNTDIATGAYVANCAPSISGLTAGVIPQAGSATTVINSSPQLDTTTNSNGLTFGGSAGYFGKSYNSTDTVDNAAITFSTGSSGDSTCPAAVSGTSYLCTKSSGISYSNNGASYSPLVTTASEYITSLTTTGTSGASTVSGGVLNIPQYSGGGGGLPTSTNAETYWSNGTTGAVTQALQIFGASTTSPTCFGCAANTSPTSLQDTDVPVGFYASLGPASTPTFSGTCGTGTSCTISSATGMPAQGVILAGQSNGNSEWMLYTLSGTTLTLTRGQFGSSTVSQASGNSINLVSEIHAKNLSTTPTYEQFWNGATAVGGLTIADLNQSAINNAGTVLLENTFVVGSNQGLYIGTSTPPLLRQYNNNNGGIVVEANGTGYTWGIDSVGVVFDQNGTFAMSSGTTSLTPPAGVTVLTGAPATAWLSIVPGTGSANGCSASGTSCAVTFINTTSGTITTSSGTSANNFAAAYTLAAKASMDCHDYGSTLLWYCN